MPESEIWRVDKTAIYWKILNGWLTKNFEEWLQETAKQHEINRDDLLLAITETIRKISAATLEVLNKENGKNINIPLFIITANPRGDLSVLSVAFLQKTGPEIFCEREKTHQLLDPLSRLWIETIALEETLAWMTGAPRTAGTANMFLTAYSFYFIELVIEKLFKLNIIEEKFIETIIEETMHYFDHFAHPDLINKFKEELAEKLKNSSNGDALIIDQKLEEKYGFKKKVQELFVEILKNNGKKDLFSPLKKYLKTP
ncbi:MAG: hypothetical protein AAB851_02375 [Patescibacteria group bacterium]